MSRDGSVTHYLPAGRWTNFLSGEVVMGPGWAREVHDFSRLPLMVRPNSILPVGSCAERPDYDYADGVTLEVYELLETSALSVDIPTIEGNLGATFQVTRVNDMVTVEARGQPKPWRLLLVGIQSIRSLEGGATESDARGVMITPLDNTNRLRISLDA